MANLVRAVLDGLRNGDEQRFGWSDYAKLLSSFSFGGNTYALGGIHQTLPGEKHEAIEHSFTAFVNRGYKDNGVVFACILARQLIFSEARFQFRRLINGRPGDLYGGRGLELLERPWTNGTTGDLLSRMEQDASLAGNNYTARRDRGPGLRRLRPDWVTIVLGSDHELEPDAPLSELDAEVLGFLYQAGGRQSKARPQLLLPDEVAHYAPVPDPIASYRGMSWLTPVLREIEGDTAANVHKLKFFENGATPNLVFALDAQVTPDDLKRFKAAVDEGHTGVTNAYKNLYLGGGADVTVVGNSFEQMSFKATQGAGETRIAAAAGVPPVIVGLSEGLQAATYSNYAQARRRFADGTIRPLWRNAAGSLASIIDVPLGSELWYDDRDIPFLQEDRKDAAEIQGVRSRTVRTLVDAGFTAESVIKAVEADDMTLLDHSGLFSVQLQKPGEKVSNPASAADDSDAA